MSRILGMTLLALPDLEAADPAGEGQEFDSTVSVAASGEAFFLPKEVSAHELTDAPAHLQAFLGRRVFNLLHERRVPLFARHNALLRKIVLNDHSTDHVDRVTLMALRIGQAFPGKFSREELGAVVVGGMFHDAAFFEAAKDWGTEAAARLMNDLEGQKAAGDVSQVTEHLLVRVESLLAGLAIIERHTTEGAALPETIVPWDETSPPTHPHLGKKELDSHTIGGRQLLLAIMNEEPLQEIFHTWDTTRRRIAADAVLYHSNGSDYDAERVSDAVKLVRLADKLDNTRERSGHLLDSRLLTDERSQHQYVPASMESMDLHVDPDEKILHVHYRCDPQFVENSMRKFDSQFSYTREKFLSDYDQIYGAKSMRYATEAWASICGDEDGVRHNLDAKIVVTLEFEDGEEAERVFSYMPLMR